MERATHDFLRESVEGVLARRLQGIDDDFEIARAQGMSNLALRDELVKDIDYLRTLVPQYTCRLNRRASPLLRLPPEIISTIIYAAVPGRDALCSWLPLGHVCHDLRLALLEMHDLWADVVFDYQYQHVQEELLERAGHCPILIVLDGDPESQLYQNALGLLRRAHTIDVQSYPREQVDTIVQILGQGSYESLEKLCLHVEDIPTSPEHTSFAWSNQRCIFAPKLRSLCLENITLPVEVSSLRNLSLTLGPDAPVQDSNTFMDMLRRCTTLERLEIDGWIPDCTELQSQQPAKPVLSFPHLIHLRMRQDFPRILEFWSLLSVPTSASIDLVFDEDNLDLQGSLERARTLRAFIAHTMIDGVTQISKFALDLRWNADGLRFTLGSTGALNPRYTTQSSLWDSRDTFAFRFTLKADVPTFDDLMALLGCIFLSLQVHVGEIEVLECDLGEFDPLIYEESTENDDYFLATFASITTLHLRKLESHIAYMLTAVSPCGNLRYFSRLQALQLEPRTWDSSMMECLIEALRVRAERGAPLRSVMLDDSASYISDEDMTQHLDELKTIVQYVETYRFRPL